MTAEPLSIKQIYQMVRGATIIAAGLHKDPREIVERMPLEDYDREYALEILRQRSLRAERARDLYNNNSFVFGPCYDPHPREPASHSRK